MKVKGVVIRVIGRVQGVGFRFYTQKTAKELGVNGYVQNKPDGSVYIEAEAEEAKLETFLLWCKQGPEWARVDKIEKQYCNSFDYKEFVIR